MKQVLGTVASNMEVMPGVYVIWIESPDIAVAAQPGQFITARCGDFTLRRPLSIHQVSSQEIALLFKVTGKGTLWLSQTKKGDRLDILGPLGKGFTIEPKARNLLLVAGGIGIAPIAFLMQRASPQHQITLIHGASTAAQLYTERCQLTAISHQRVKYVPITEDGSLGRKGKATDILPDFLDWADQVYACGPADMYKAMALTLSASPLKGEEKTIVGEGLVPSHNLKLKKCQVSLEVRMGCGFGACYSCTINTKKGLKRVCRDGPVFELDDIIW